MSKRRAWPPERRVLTDPRAIRALAHPARLTVLDALSEGEELTATECAEITGVSPSAMSYHLRALEKWGFVERAASATDGRERPWQAVSGGWRIEATPNQEVSAATNVVTATTLDRVRGELARWFDRERAQSPEWRAVTVVDSQHRWLTPDEADQLDALYREFMDARRDRTAADHPAGARRVRVVRILVPVRFGE